MAVHPLIPQSEGPLGAPNSLQPWQARFAAWLADQPGRVSKALQCEMATRFANKRRDAEIAAVAVTYKQLRILKATPAFQTFVAALQADGVERARALLTSQLPEYVELHRWAAQRAKEKDDPRAMAALTVPALDRAMPKREAGTVAQQVVSIHLTSKQLETLNAPPVVMEWEALPPADRS